MIERTCFDNGSTLGLKSSRFACVGQPTQERLSCRHYPVLRTCLCVYTAHREMSRPSLFPCSSTFKVPLRSLVRSHVFVRIESSDDAVTSLAFPRFFCLGCLGFLFRSYEKEIADYRTNPSNYAEESEASDSDSDESSEESSDESSEEDSDEDSDADGDESDDAESSDDGSDDGVKAKKPVKTQKVALIRRL